MSHEGAAGDSLKGNPPQGAEQPRSEIEMVLGAIEQKFVMMSQVILGRSKSVPRLESLRPSRGFLVDEMAGKINELEQSMGVLMERAGVDPAEVEQELAKNQATSTSAQQPETKSDTKNQE